MLQLLRHLLPAAVAAAAAVPAAAAAPGTPGTPGTPDVPAHEGYDLVWHDEFDVDGPPDSANWMPELGFVRNREDQLYQPQNAEVRGGKLVFTARRETVPDPDHRPGSGRWQERREEAHYTSASFRTARRDTGEVKHEWLYGRFEMRGRFDTDPGVWPAWWTLGRARDWPGCGEIDIMEFYGGDLKANLFWGSARAWQPRKDGASTPLESLGDPERWASEFHTWRMDWTRDEVALYVDDRLLNRVELDRTFNDSPDGANPFREPHHMLLNLAVGGQAAPDPSRTAFPRTFEVDWVRVYQKSEPPAAAAVPPARPGGAPKPNLVVILSDDQGYADAGFNGGLEIPTPNIDRVAARGVRFTDGYATYSVCGPSRAGLLTGRYQNRFGASENPTNDPSVLAGIPLDEKNIAELLRPAGYRSYAVGKWHVGSHPSLRPLARGFDGFFGFLSGGHRYLPEELTIERLEDVKKPWDWYRTKILRDDEPVEIDRDLTDELSDAAAGYIDEAADAGAPFFLYLAYNAPHTPLQATREYLDRFTHIADTDRRTYAAMVSAMDDGIGRVLDRLAERGLERDTIVFFLSDNGGATNNGSRNTPLRGWKGSSLEGGIRVPFAASWPGVLPEGGRYTEPVSALDIAATIVAEAGLAPPTDKPLDGVNLVPHLRGEAGGVPHRTLYWRWERAGRYAVREGDTKLIVSEADGGGEKQVLFDLHRDPGEGWNILQHRDAPDDLPALRGRLDRWSDGLVPMAYPPLGSWLGK